MLPSPRLNALHRRRFQRQFAALDQHTPDGTVRISVLIRVADAHGAPVGKVDAARALDLREERFNRVVQPNELPSRQSSFSCFDVRSRPIRHDALAVETAANALAL